MTFIDRKC